MIEYRENDSGANRKNSCDRSYRSYRNCRTDHTEAALIEQHIFYIVNGFLFEPIFLYTQQSTLYNSPIIAIQVH